MTIKDKAGQASAAAKDRANAAKAAASDGLTVAKEKATAAKYAAADGIDANPIAALVGGLALGALAAVVLPRTRKEDELMGEVGGRINESARGAAMAAKDAGLDKLDELGITKEAAIDKAKELAQSAADVARETASAAASGAKGR